MSAPRYEVRCADGFTTRLETERRAREVKAVLDSPVDPECGPHTVWSIDPDGTETDITDEQGAQE